MCGWSESCGADISLSGCPKKPDCHSAVKLTCPVYSPVDTGAALTNFSSYSLLLCRSVTENASTGIKWEKIIDVLNQL